MPETPPADLEQVRYAFRLGWIVAELRGRYRPDLFDGLEPGNPGGLLREEYELPLANERSPTEMRIELIEAARDLSGALGLDPREEQDRPIFEQIEPLLKQMEASKADREQIWLGRPHEPDSGHSQPSLAYKLFKWDAKIQDDLVLRATQAAAYQLGRGLADTYWGLYPDRPAQEMGSWESVLGRRRRDTLLRFAGRLSAYVGPSVLAAIDGSLRSWSKLATEPHGRGEPGVPGALFQQGLLWRDLVRGERQPEDLLTNKDLNAPPTAEVWKELKLYRVAAESLKWPLITGVVGAVLLAGGAALLAGGNGRTGLTTAISVLGLLGLTSAGMYAKAKTQVTSLFSHLSERVRQERIRQAADLCPASCAGP